VRDISLKIVRQTFETYVSKGQIYRIPFSLPPNLTKPESGVFVAAFEQLGLTPRGRVGAIFPSAPTLAEEIQMHTISLAKTYAFRKQDLPFLTYELLITKTPHRLSNLDDLKQENGLLVRTDTGKIAFSLPSHNNKSPQQRFSESCAKEGINIELAHPRIYQFLIERFNEK
jgi:hypothetical protein